MPLIKIQQPILEWFAGNQRSFPWRMTSDPWLILLSEVMLQQTQTSRVLSRWPEFVQRYPTVTSCANGSRAELIALWSGLGFNRRAVNLHRCAQTVRDSHNGHFPTSLEELLALPGIGPYTARAIRVFAFNKPEAVVDTNVARVLARTEGRQLKPGEVQSLADASLTVADPWAWNQALLDLGAMVCTAKQPDCHRCPAVKACAWQNQRRPQPDPAKGSAKVSGPQSTFAGSDRQGRGRLVAALADRPVPADQLAATMGWSGDPDRARLVAQRVCDDGLAAFDGSDYRLP